MNSRQDSNELSDSFLIAACQLRLGPQTTEEQPVGYETDRFTTAISSNLMCQICNGVLRNPVLLICGHTFCKFCINNWSFERSVRICPKCRWISTSMNESFRQPPSKLIEDLNKLEMRCKNVNAGCSFVSFLPEVESHEKSSCPFSNKY